MRVYSSASFQHIFMQRSCEYIFFLCKCWSGIILLPSESKRRTNGPRLCSRCHGYLEFFLPSPLQMRAGVSPSSRGMVFFTESPRGGESTGSVWVTPGQEQTMLAGCFSRSDKTGRKPKGAFLGVRQTSMQQTFDLSERKFIHFKVKLCTVQV